MTEGIDKTAIRNGAVEHLRGSLEKGKLTAQHAVYAQEGAQTALKNVFSQVLTLVDETNADIDEKGISIEWAAYVRDFMVRVQSILKHEAKQSADQKKLTQGVVLGLEQSLKMAEKQIAVDSAKAERRAEEAAERAENDPHFDPDNPRHPGPNIKEERRLEDEAAEKAAALEAENEQKRRAAKAEMKAAEDAAKGEATLETPPEPPEAPEAPPEAPQDPEPPPEAVAAPEATLTAVPDAPETKKRKRRRPRKRKAPEPNGKAPDGQHA